MKKYWIFFDVLFLPLTLMYPLATYLSFPQKMQNILDLLLFPLMITGLFLRILFIPHILACILLLLSILRLKQDYCNGEFQKTHLFGLVLAIVVCAANLGVLEIVFWHGMSV